MGAEAVVFVVPVPGDPANLAVTDLELVSGVLRKGTTARYRATVRNCGTAPASNISVQCRVDDVQIEMSGTILAHGDGLYALQRQVGESDNEVHLRRLLELNLGDAERVERDIEALSRFRS